MSLDIAAINAALFSRLKTDAAGLAVRLATGPKDGSGVIPAHPLPQPLPAFPFLAWRGGIVSGAGDAMRAVNGAWWVYDAPSQGYVRINGLITLVEAAYDLDAIPFARTTITQIGQELEDATLGGLLVRSITVTARRLA